MNSKYKVLKFKSNNFKNVDDLVSIEEPLEISIKYKNNDKWVTQILSITMRTPGHDFRGSYNFKTSFMREPFFLFIYS